MSEPEPFDPGSPFDAMAETVRRRVATIALDMPKAAIFREMDSMRQLECFIAGTVTALIGVSFAHIEAAGRDDMMKVITDYIPQARQQAEAMLDNPVVRDD